MALLPAWHAGILGSATEACVIDYTHRMAQRKGVAISNTKSRQSTQRHTAAAMKIKETTIIANNRHEPRQSAKRFHDHAVRWYKVNNN